MDAVSYSLASKQAQRIEKFIENPDSTSGIVTVPKTIASGETVTVPAGRVAVLPNIVVDGTLNIDGEVFIPSGSSVDFSNGIKIDGNNIALSIPTAYHLLQGNLSVSNEVITNGFSTTLYTGNGGTQTINTGVDMATQWGNDASEMFGGLVWGKSRSVIGSNWFTDTVRGNTKKVYSNLIQAEYIDNAGNTGFTSTGFNLGLSGDGNANAVTYASWNFQTTHRRTGVTNHGKAFTEHYNPFTGFTIIKYEGSGIAGHEIPHALDRKLGFVVVKNLSVVAGWVATYRENNILALNLTDAESVNTGYYSSIASNQTTLNSNTVGCNASTNQYIMYGWANSYLDETNKLIGNYEVGIYQGTGIAGNKVKTRGKPAWIMIKRLDGTGVWNIYCNQVTDGRLIVNLSNAESTYDATDFVSDGFILKSVADSEHNFAGGQYLYMVVYDNDSGSGKSKYPKATDTSNVQINNAIIPLAHGVDSNGSKNSIVIANETITGLTYTQGKNYLYKTDTGYGVKPYEPRMLSSELVRRFAGEQPDYFDVDSNKWFNTDAGSELVTNGKFDVNINGWTAYSSTISWVNGTLQIIPNASVEGGAYATITTVIGKKYTLIGSIIQDASSYAKIRIGTIVGDDNIAITAAGVNKHTLSFIAQSTTTYVSVNIGGGDQQNTKVDDISVFETDITPTTEITESRNYLNHIVHADQNGQVTYVEELPKVEYKDVVKANEYKGKNACTAYIVFDATTTVPTILDSYGILAIIRVSVGLFDIYIDMDNISYELKGSVASSYNGTGVVALTEDTVIPRTKNKVRVHSGYVNSTVNYTLLDFKYNSVNIFGGKN